MDMSDEDRKKVQDLMAMKLSGYANNLRTWLDLWCDDEISDKKIAKELQHIERQMVHLDVRSLLEKDVLQ